MSSLRLFLQRPTSLILILVFQALFGPPPDSPTAYVGSIPAPGSTHITKTIICARGFTVNGNNAYCLLDLQSMSVVPLSSCYVPDSNITKGSFKSIYFPQCWKKEKRYQGAHATSFEDHRNPHVIYVLEGTISGSSDAIPKRGLTCAWSDVRPRCDVPAS
ncbi:hypothetical protein O181_032630 [Austropuccinia psidii MF-1]|uniref:Sushi domain-containing protein n=1 Tax=Austropuccinia psidii MF-1 TaxID=1389203 RepID=A0A9Q3CZY4_9BASI|nr:hypothetical protein [Austropuccinia psidii MF-1]